MTKPAQRLTSPAFSRNIQPIQDVLSSVLAGRCGHVLEIGSGPGQHVAAFAAAMPALTWWPSDPDSAHLDSIEAWRQECGCPNLMPPIPLDATKSDWPPGCPGLPAAGDLTAILCINVLHIAPWAVAKGCLRGAARLLARDGCMILYGPFSSGGRPTAPSNAAFDASLRARNPEWGVRDRDDIASLALSCGLEIDEAVAMPSNNLCLILRRVPEPA